MNTTLTKKNEGFTIIEVVLVLAIAGLIFLIVFLALPQLQASRRDTQRKNDAGRLLAAAENYAGNHNGVYPAGGTIDATWIADNIAGVFTDPSSGATYTVTDGYPASGVPEGSMAYDRNSACPTDGSDGVTTGGGDREIAVVVGLENGEYCQDNQ